MEFVMHTWNKSHNVNWEEVRVIHSEPLYWKKIILEAIWIRKKDTMSNLDCGFSWDSITHFRLLIVSLSISIGPSNSYHINIVMDTLYLTTI